MQNIPWFLVLFISIPQAILVIYIGFGLCNIAVDFRKSVLCSVLFAMVTYFVRPLAIPLVLNTFMLTTFLIITTGLIFKIHLTKTLIACLLGVMISGVIENLVIQMLLWVRPHIADKLSVDAVLNILIYIPVFLVTMAMLFMIKRLNFVLIGLGESGENDEQR